MKKRKLSRLLPAAPRSVPHMKFLPKFSFAAGSPLHIIFFEIASLVVVFNIWRLTGMHIIGALVFLAILQIALWYFLKIRQKKRKQEIELQLAPALDILARVYRIHPNLKTALAEVCIHLPKGAALDFFQEARRLSTFGMSAPAALLHANKNLESEDITFIASCLEIHLSQGGDISSQMGHMAQLLRRRAEVSEEVGNAMFQNKISAVFTSLFVPLIIFLVFSINTEGYRQILKNPTGRAIFLVSLGWWAMGIIIMRRLMRVAV